MENNYERTPIYVIGVNDATWGKIKTWDLNALNVQQVLVQEDLYSLEFSDPDKRSSFEMCMLMNHIQVEDFELAEYSTIKV